MLIVFLILTLLFPTSLHAAEWAIDSVTGCKIWGGYLNPDQSVYWNGPCDEKGIANGQGTLKWFYKHSYSGKSSNFTGFLKNGKSEGQGTYNYLEGIDKNRYVGEFKNGLATGAGTFILENGDECTGEWKKGKFIKHETCTAVSDNQDVGEFNDNNILGKKTITLVEQKKKIKLTDVIIDESKDNFTKVTTYESKIPEKFINADKVLYTSVSIMAFVHEDKARYRASYSILAVQSMFYPSGQCNNTVQAYASEGVELNVKLISRSIEKVNCIELIKIDLPSIYLQRLSNKPTKMKLFGKASVEFEIPPEYAKAILAKTK